MRVLIVAAGPIEDVPALAPFITDQTTVIGVDGGIATLAEQGLDCDVAIGDFDSLGYVPDGGLLHPAEKDETDLELALRYANEHHAGAELLIFGASGGRLDMTLQNVYLLKQFPAARLVTKREDVRYWRVGQYELASEGYHYLSFIPLVPSNLTLRGVKYPLTEHPVPVGGSLTVSNEWNGVAQVTVTEGEVLVLRTHEK
ncbi:thiamine diphosphokinase [Exiguobacterium sp. s193]|uniref:thiamine diphosphokinase n=1 Tax=Exiguobacterium sp. s193 TaxID=2751207 RepID=UPI001BE7FE7E|nr:thiamine diphosphokinase [Exiguobacterium sp. s193]